MYNELTIANSLLKRAMSENRHITPMKLQKLLYFLYRDYLQTTRRPLFSERFMTWKYGPVLESVYHYFKHFGANPITSYAVRDGGIFVVDESADLEFQQIINNVWEKGKIFSGIQLSQMTHAPNGAWNKAYQGNQLLLSDKDILEDHTLIEAVC